MKRIFYALLFVPALCFSQNKLQMNHFWDIPWGVSIEQAEKVFDERGFSSFRGEKCLITHAKYEREAATIILVFNKVNRFCSANVVYSSTDDTVLTHYDNYRKVLFRRYGMPDKAVEYYDEPYEKGDGKVIEAIQAGKSLHFTEWKFNDNCFASVTILPNINICLTFKNPAYEDSTVARQ